VRPTSREILVGISDGLQRDVLPAVTDPFVQSKVGLMSYLLRLVADGCDDEGLALHASIARREAVLETGASVLAGVSPDLATRSREAARGGPVEGGRAELRSREQQLDALITEMVVLCEEPSGNGALAELRTALYRAVVDPHPAPGD
jgi:hypothetical protein